MQGVLKGALDAVRSAAPRCAATAFRHREPLQHRLADQSSRMSAKYRLTSIVSADVAPAGSHLIVSAALSTVASRGVDRSKVRPSRSTSQYSSTPSSR